MIKEHLRQYIQHHELSARVHALLIFTTRRSLAYKRHAFEELVEDERARIADIENQLREPDSNTSTMKELAQELNEAKEALSVFALYQDVINHAMHDPSCWRKAEHKRPAYSIENDQKDESTRYRHLGTYYEYDEERGFVSHPEETSNTTFVQWRPCDINRSTTNSSDDEPQEENDAECIVGISGRETESLFFMNDDLGSEIFGPDDEHLASLASLFVGIFKPVTMLELDFEPFYKKRQGIVLKAAEQYTVTCGDKEEFVVIGEMVLAKTGSTWSCGDLRMRHFFGSIDPVGPYFNSYTTVKEIDSPYGAEYDLLALESLIEPFLYLAEDDEAFSEDDDQYWGGKERRKQVFAVAAERYMLQAIKTKLDDDPTLGGRIIDAFNDSDGQGPTYDELIKICDLNINRG